MEIRAKKSLGQHFLTSSKALSLIMKAADIRSGEYILEIGPGTGILTAEIIKTGAKVIAVEKDVRSIEFLKTKFNQEINSQQLILLNEDILEFNPLEYGLTNGNFALIANIPYYITGAILEKFLEHEPRPNRAVLLVQKEVADRIIVKDGKESILSVSVRVFGEPEISAKIGKNSFSPPPKVDSAILSIKNIKYPQFEGIEGKFETDRFFSLIKTGFAHKRKYAFSNLKEKYTEEQISNVWRQLNLDPKIRPEKIEYRTWVQISTLLKN